MTDLAERLGQDLPSAWRPDQEDPDVLIGEVMSLDMGTSDYGSYPLLVIRQDDGTEKAIHAFHTVLRNELIRQKPQVGERLGVKYLGEQKTKPGSKFSSFIGYRAKVERETATEFNWSNLDAEPDPRPEAKAPEQEPVNVPAGAGDDDVPF